MELKWNILALGAVIGVLGAFWMSSRAPATK